MNSDSTILMRKFSINVFIMYIMYMRWFVVMLLTVHSNDKIFAEERACVQIKAFHYTDLGTFETDTQKVQNESFSKICIFKMACKQSNVVFYAQEFDTNLKKICEFITIRIK